MPYSCSVFGLVPQPASSEHVHHIASSVALEEVQLPEGASSIVIDDGVQVTVLLQMRPLCTVHVYCGAASQVEVVLLAERMECSGRFTAVLAEGSSLECMFGLLRCTGSFSAKSELLGSDSESTMRFGVLSAENDTMTIDAKNVFRAPRGGGEIDMKGVAKNTATVRCHGMIEIGENGGGTNTYLTQDVLMLDPTAKVDAIPGLEIKTNDVKASHSATVSRLTAEHLFYFAARGIPEEEAKALAVEGFIGAMFDDVEDGALREKCREWMEKVR